MYSKNYKPPGRHGQIRDSEGKSSESRFSKSMDVSRPSVKAKEFPPRKRSIPYGFDFDLDEVWGPSNPHLHSMYKGRKGLASSGSGSGSSDNSIGAEHQRVARDRRSNSAQMRGGGRKNNSEDSNDEFAVDDEDIFQQIGHLADKLDHQRIRSGSETASQLSSGLPSAKTLRGGQSVVARGRHTTFDRSLSSSTLGNSVPGSATASIKSSGSRGSSLCGSGRSGGAVSPLHSPRKHSNKLTPGLGAENNRQNRRSRLEAQQRSQSTSPHVRS